MVTTATTTTAVNATTLTATCPGTNPIVIGGGYIGIGAGGNGQYATDSSPTASDKWTVTIAATDSSWTVYAICSK
jgi:hypothetical protein